MAWHAVSAKSLREKSEKDVPEKSGIYKWWARKADLQDILKALGLLKLNEVLTGIEKKDERDLYCIYVGQAESLDARLKGSHVNGRDKSTFRKSVEAVVKKLYGGRDVAKKTDSFIDGLEIEYRFVAKDKLDSAEEKEIGEKYLRIFNQQHNGENGLRKKYGIYNALKNLRGEL